MLEEFLVATTDRMVDNGLADNMINRHDAKRPRDRDMCILEGAHRPMYVQLHNTIATPAISTDCVVRRVEGDDRLSLLLRFLSPSSDDD